MLLCELCLRSATILPNRPDNLKSHARPVPPVRIVDERQLLWPVVLPHERILPGRFCRLNYNLTANPLTLDEHVQLRDVASI